MVMREAILIAAFGLGLALALAGETTTVFVIGQVYVRGSHDLSEQYAFSTTTRSCEERLLVR